MTKTLLAMALLACAALGCGDNGDRAVISLPPSQKPCGGFGAIRCDANEICVYQPGADCGAADQQGSCIAVPATCGPADGPVCGCDSRRYASLCDAQTAKVSLENTNTCP